MNKWRKVFFFFSFLFSSFFPSSICLVALQLDYTVSASVLPDYHVLSN